MKPVITTHQEQTADFSSVILNQSPLFQAPLDQFFSSYLILGILATFLSHQLQHELPQTQGLSVYLS